MATPTQAPTKVPQEPDPFYYDYDTVQTVGMTLATILFLLGILIIISKKVKCRKADSRSESPTCKSCKSELPSSASGAAWLLVLEKVDPLGLGAPVKPMAAECLELKGQV
ncbi:FXYD domain-containing ion transport regulator 7 [Leptonychotes weddellii]|uniref:FXYD domain-containing ion transport regulator n=1 Tax=Leptonychotes weddellii TaxID=9713 RepID=A0A7F8Q1C5_LEPWE|nr:FXYD domain-containing ion transport regulator 7 [Leptonychotes weddellii]